MYGNKAVKGIIFNNGKILFLEKEKVCSPNLWDLPGGLIENDESIIQALNREVLEETGIESHNWIWSYIGAWTFIRSYDNALIQVSNYVCRTQQKYLPVKLSDEHISFNWIEPIEIESLKIKDKSLADNLRMYFKSEEEKRTAKNNYDDNGS